MTLPARLCTQIEAADPGASRGYKPRIPVILMILGSWLFWPFGLIIFTRWTTNPPRIAGARAAIHVA